MILVLIACTISGLCFYFGIRGLFRVFREEQAYKAQVNRRIFHVTR